jgi:DNA (cytosine-5)-methyltransferase 1
MNHLSLFSGIGGIDLAAEWAGFQTVAFCEQNEFCQQVLAKHWPGVPIYDDVKTLTAKSLGTGPITLLSGGFPCQPFSEAGEQRGQEDDRYLWPEMLRVIKEVRPTWILAENVTGIIAMELDNVLSDLEKAAYETETYVLPACAIGALHIRKRVFIVAHSEGIRGQQRGRLQQQEYSPAPGYLHKWRDQPMPARVAYGLPSRLERVKALGNAVMPQVAYPFLKAIADYELQESTSKP